MTKLLIVDDNEQNLYMLQVLLEGHGYQVISARDGAEALEVAWRDPPDMIITDILMPVMDGFALCRHWKKDEQLKEIPLVFYTATYTDRKDEEFALSLGAERFIIKPTEPDVFVELLREVFEEHKAGRLVAPRKPVEEEEVFYKEYNEALIRKLEFKMAELEKANRALERDIAERLRAEEEVRRRNRELMLLNSVIAAATSTLNMKQVLQITCQELAQAFDLPGVVAALLNTERTELTVVAECLAPGRPSALGTTIPVLSNPATQYVLKHQAPLVVTDAQTDEQLASVHNLTRERGTRSLFIVPLVARDQVAGTIGLDAIERREFSEEEITLTQNVAAAAGQALETARLYQALQGHAEELEATVAQRTAELQVALEQARSADRVKSEFVSNVSHELRTPLTNLKLFLTLLTKGRSDKRQVYLDTMRRETDRLQELIESLLDLSRLDLGKTQANLQPTDVNLLVGGLAADRWALAADRGLTLDVELEEPTSLALADPKLIEQVVTNLFTNAVNYTPAGGTITLHTGLVEADDGRWATISVIDTGPGISEEEQAQLFERFFRGKAGQTSDAPGTGLGLAIAKEIIDRHGGRVTVESQVGQGSTFTTWLPVA